ncbi:hypothetical protein LBMAG56_07560 [Verrucomicrobiota bacterium]|nr:hypothetical protein LBMAG56_07560 [Verrucomicrobiota bacterium]
MRRTAGEPDKNDGGVGIASAGFLGDGAHPQKVAEAEVEAESTCGECAGLQKTPPGQRAGTTI